MSTYTISVIASLDGFVAGVDDDVMALPMDPAFDAHNLERMEAADTLLLGATSYRGFLSYWPPVADDPSRPEVERAISRRWAEMDKVVVSDTLTPAGCGSWRDRTRIVARRDAVAAVRALREAGGAGTLTFGSATTWRPLLAAGVVDELHVMVGATLLGAGTPLVGPGAATSLRLLAVRPHEGSDNVVLVYRPR